MHGSQISAYFALNAIIYNLLIDHNLFVVINVKETNIEIKLN